ncbi:hypothetical protein KKA15_04020 [Patescibacteria group bacterium]|nr:hypothetical protein [Patescibacteria group bacterium]
MTDSERNRLLGSLQEGINAQFFKLTGGVPLEEAEKLRTATEQIAGGHVDQIEEIRKKSKKF